MCICVSVLSIYIYIDKYDFFACSLIWRALSHVIFAWVADLGLSLWFLGRVRAHFRLTLNWVLESLFLPAPSPPCLARDD